MSSLFRIHGLDLQVQGLGLKTSSGRCATRTTRLEQLWQLDASDLILSVTRLLPETRFYQRLGSIGDWVRTKYSAPTSRLAVNLLALASLRAPIFSVKY